MIAKHVSMKSLKKSDFAGLVKYLTDSQSKLERVGNVTVTNCHSDQAETAVTEVLNTQAQNKRATSDKTYHLVVSFRAGEQPGDDVLAAIEACLCAGLGYADHQRVSVVHHDTDHLHVHIAINKIHPSRYTIHNPHNDHRMLGELCESLEHVYGLERDNHQQNKRGAENRASDMEHQAGIESLLGWIKRECHDQMQGAGSWAELHRVMHSNGLELHERGNGLVVSAGDGTTVKASSIHRTFSKAKLVARFGAFQPLGERSLAEKPKRAYRQEPMRSKVDTVELYARYMQEQRDAVVHRAVAWAEARDRKNRMIEAAKRNGRLKRGAIKLIDNSRLTKRLLYAATSRALLNEIDGINKRYFKERRVIHEQHSRRTWADWLRARAEDGDAEALAALRGRQAGAGIAGNSLGGKHGVTAGPVRVPVDGVTKLGTIIYCVGATVVRDGGDKLNISRGASDQHGLQVAMQLAIARFGSCIRVDGTSDFKERIARVAAASNLDITFDDAILELRRHELQRAPITTEESKHEQAAQSRQQQRRYRGRIVRARSSGARTIAAAQTGAGGKPNICGIGRSPPPEGKNRLRGLPELGVVRISSGTEVLLPRDVSRHMEQQGAAADNGVRRGISGTGLVDPFAAVDQYVFEQEQARAKSFDIPKFARYDGFEGRAVFAGIRKVNEQRLALLKHGEEIKVMPIDEATAERLKRTALGDAVMVGSQGLIKTKGRRR